MHNILQEHLGTLQAILLLHDFILFTKQNARNSILSCLLASGIPWQHDSHTALRMYHQMIWSKKIAMEDFILKSLLSLAQIFWVNGDKEILWPIQLKNWKKKVIVYNRSGARGKNPSLCFWLETSNPDRG